KCRGRLPRWSAVRLPLGGRSPASRSSSARCEPGRAGYAAFGGFAIRGVDSVEQYPVVKVLPSDAGVPAAPGHERFPQQHRTALDQREGLSSTVRIDGVLQVRPIDTVAIRCADEIVTPPCWAFGAT